MTLRCVSRWRRLTLDVRLKKMRFAITAALLGFVSTALGEGTPSLRELMRSGIDAAKTNDVEKLESIFPSASQHPWSEFKQLIETVGSGAPVEQLMTSSLVGYSPYVEKALATFHNHRKPEVRLCVLSAAVERFFPQGRKLEAEHLKELRELTESDDAIIAARGLLSLMVATTPSDPEYDRIRESIHKKLTEIDEPDQVAEDLMRYLKERLPKPPKGSAGQPATRSESDSEGGDKPQPEAEARSR